MKFACSPSMDPQVPFTLYRHESYCRTQRSQVTTLMLSIGFGFVVEGATHHSRILQLLQIVQLHATSKLMPQSAFSMSDEFWTVAIEIIKFFGCMLTSHEPALM